MTNFDQYIASATKSETKKSGKYLDRLDASERHDVEMFGEWLATTGMSANSVASYRAYIAQAMCAAHDEIEFSALSSSVRSAIKKFAEFKKS